MTNGEKIQKDFKGCEVCEPIVEDDIIHVIFADKKDSAIGFDWSWWNAEYIEPTTKNDEVIEGCECFTCKYGDWKRKGWSLDMADDKCGGCCSWSDKYEPIEPTTKNDLGVESDLFSSFTEKISEKVKESHEEFIFETIRPYCENVVQMKISKRDLEQALLKYYGKNDLAVDCISREQALKELKESAEHHVNDSREEVLLRRDRDIIRALPSVTPQEPRWIPTSERLPEEDGYYYATIYDTDEDYLYMDIAELEDGIWQYKDYIKVLAWMPLPEPYEPQDSEDKE